MQEVLSAVNLAKGFRELNKHLIHAMTKLYTNAELLQIDGPVLPQFKRLPKRLDQGSKSHEIEIPKDYFRQQ